MTSEPITWETINDMACQACGIQPATLKVLLPVAPTIELTPNVCRACSDLPAHKLKEMLL